MIQIVHETLRDIKEGKTGKRENSEGVKVAVPKKAKVWEMNPFDRTESLAIDPEGFTCQVSVRENGAWFWGSGSDCPSTRRDSLVRWVRERMGHGSGRPGLTAHRPGGIHLSGECVREWGMVLGVRV